ncbi:MAG: T9SS type A sorting domain-containing protein [Saprospiraceae bacterium]
MQNWTSRFFLFIVFSAFVEFSFAQSYTSYFTGDTSDVNTTTQGVTVLMGGATENDNAMIWFLQHSGGGDIVVIRASGSNGYNSYLYSGLGVSVNSVETILFKNGIASHDPYVVRQIRNAEALWIAGGDQWDYVSYWKKTPIDTAINYLINVKHVPVGGTSAGMAVLGTIVNTAQNGSVTSEAALANPYDAKVKLLNGGFIDDPILHNVITDTHYDNPDRRGRHIAFLARIFQDDGLAAYGIACEEYTAICIDVNGIASIYGNFPADDDFAYFLQVNCSLPNNPENCSSGQPLTWDRNHEAVSVYKVAGTQNGVNTFDLNDWMYGTGGTWENWSVTNGALNINSTGTAPDCISSTDDMDLNATEDIITVYPNPAQDMLAISIPGSTSVRSIIISNRIGQKMVTINNPLHMIRKDISLWENGLYFINVRGLNRQKTIKFIKN